MSRFGRLPTVSNLDQWLKDGSVPVNDPVTGITIGRLDIARAASEIPNPTPSQPQAEMLRTPSNNQPSQNTTATTSNVQTSKTTATTSNDVLSQNTPTTTSKDQISENTTSTTSNDPTSQTTRATTSNNQTSQNSTTLNGQASQNTTNTTSNDQTSQNTTSATSNGQTSQETTATTSYNQTSQTTTATSVSQDSGDTTDQGQTADPSPPSLAPHFGSVILVNFSISTFGRTQKSETSNWSGVFSQFSDRWKDHQFTKSGTNPSTDRSSAGAAKLSPSSTGWSQSESPAQLGVGQSQPVGHLHRDIRVSYPQRLPGGSIAYPRHATLARSGRSR